MAWELKADRPIYTQLVEQVKLRIVAGIYAPGEKLPPVRDFAAEAAVNPNTMQKALAELENSGLIFPQRTSGRFVTEDVSIILEAKNTMAEEVIREFLENMRKLGFSDADTVMRVKTDVEGEGIDGQ